MAIFTANITSALTALSLQLEPSSLAGLNVGRPNYTNSSLILVLSFSCVCQNVGNCARNIGQISVISRPYRLKMEEIIVWYLDHDQ